MIKKHVNLHTWLAEYVKLLSKKFDLSESEITRVMMEAFIATHHPFLAKIKPNLTPKQVFDMLESANDKEDYHTRKSKVIAEISIEAKKVVDAVKKTKIFC